LPVVSGSEEPFVCWALIFVPSGTVFVLQKCGADPVGSTRRGLLWLGFGRGSLKIASVFWKQTDRF
jgi:hypothetical protein